MITVCQIVHNLTVGGAELLAACISRRLSDRYRFVFACLDERGDLAERLEGDGISVSCLHRRPGTDWSCLRQLSALFRRERVDVLHAHQYAAFFYAAAARLAGPNPPVIFTEHGRTFPDMRRRKRVWANRLLLRQRDRVIGVGDAVRQALIDNEGIAPSRVSVIYNGVDVGNDASRYLQRNAARAELGYGEEEFVILHVARLDPLKDHATALRAFAQLSKLRPQARLVLVGDGPEREAISRQIAELEIADRVRLLGLRYDVPRLWSVADAALLTSRSEGIPLTILEAMAAGLPVVATRVGGVAEVVIDGDTGLLCDTGDVLGLADRLERIATDDVFARRLGEAGNRRAVRYFSAERMYQQYDDLYRELAGA